MIKNAFILSASALETLWFDTCCVKRRRPIVKENGADGFQVYEVYTDIKCHYSKKAISSNQTKENYQTEYEHTLFYSKDYTFLMGDEVIINSKGEGNFITFKLSEPIIRLSHAQVNLKGEKKA